MHFTKKLLGLVCLFCMFTEICLISMSVLPRISTCYYNENVTYDLALLKIESMIEYTSSIKTKFDEQLRK